MKHVKGFLNNSKVHSERNLIYIPSAEQESKAYEIFQFFGDMFKGIFEKLPERPRFLDSEQKVRKNINFLVVFISVF